MDVNLRPLLLGVAALGTALPVIAGKRAWWAWPVAHATIILPSVTRNHAVWGPLVRSFKTSSREVWLTIDDGPTRGTTIGYLDLLREHDAKATFFMIGSRADRLRAIAKAVVESGHGLGNHTYHHWSSLWWSLPPSLVCSEIERGGDAIHAATGVYPTGFRCPVGMTNPWVHPVLDAKGVRLIGWSASGVDGLLDRGTVVVDRIMRRIRPGAIVVLHESEMDSERRLETLALLLSRLAADGWRCVLPEQAQLS